MFSWFRKPPVRKSAIGLSIVLLVGLGVLAGSMIPDRNERPAFVFPESALHAAGAVRAEQFAMATGAMEGGVEGLFTLDFLTGNLQCVAIYVKGQGAQKFGALFRTNVIRDLGLDKSKKPNYLMVTGESVFVGFTGQTRPAETVVYVMDANTGNFAAYGLMWNTTAALRGGTQTGELILLGKGMARVDQLRDN